MLPGTQVWSRARTKALFDDEQQFIAPGLQTIALLSELAIERGRGATLTDLDGNDLPRSERRRVGGEPRARAPALRGCADGAAPGGERRQLHLEAARRAGAADRRPGAWRSQARPVLQRRRRSGRSGHPAGALVHEADRHHRIHRRVSRQDGRRAAAVRRRLEARGRSAADRLSSGAVSGSDDLRRIGGGLSGGVHRRASRASSTATPKGRSPRSSSSRFRARRATSCRRRDSWRACSEVARECGALLIADEMITGFGRTGLMFGCNHDDVEPDIMTMGKGMASGFPVSAVLSTDEIVAAEPFSLPSASSSSYGGNPLAAAAGLVTIQTILRRGARREFGARRAGCSLRASASLRRGIGRSRTCAVAAC